MAARSWIVPDELWELIEPLLPAHPRRLRYPGRKRLPDRPALCGILFVLHTGIAWRHPPPELGFGLGITCWRCLDEWQRAGVWESLHARLLARLRAAGEIDFSRAVADSSHVQAKKGGDDVPIACSPTAATTTTSTGGGCVSAAARRRSAVAGPSTAPASVASAGWWSAAASLGCTGSVACWSATSAAPTSTRRSSTWPAA